MTTGPSRSPARRSSASSAIIVAGAAAFSRILGFIRDVMIAAVLGAGPAAEALAVALRLPNLARRMVSEGAVNAGFVPLHAQIMETGGPTAAADFAGRALTTIGLGVIALSAVATLAAGALIALLAGGFAPAEPARDIAITATRLALPAIALMTLAALIGAVLAAHRRFVAVSLSPLVVNLAMIALLSAPAFGFTPTPQDMALALAATMSLGSLMQLALVAAALRRQQGGVRLRRPGFDADQRRLLRLALPALTAAAGSQLILLAAMPAASTVPGALAYLHYAERVFLLPLGLIAALAGIVLLPQLTHRATLGQRALFDAAARRARHDALLLALPAAIGLVLLAQPIATALFARGAFDAADARETAGLLAGLACGLPFAVLTRINEQTLFARQHVRTPALIALASFALALPACALGTRLAGAAGLGLGIAIAFAGQWLALHWIARDRDRRRRPRHAALIRRRLACLIAANVVFALLVLGAHAFMPLTSLPVLIGFCLVAVLAYGLIATLTGLAGRHDPRRAMRRSNRAA